MRSLSRQLIAIKRPCLVIGNEIALRNDNGPGKDEGYEDKDKGLLQKGSVHALMVRGGALHLSPTPPPQLRPLASNPLKDTVMQVRMGVCAAERESSWKHVSTGVLGCV